MVGLWAYNPPAILAAVNDDVKEGKLGQIKIVGFDENAETLQGIDDGNIYGTVVQNPQFGYQSVKMMAALVAAATRSKVPAGRRRFPSNSASSPRTAARRNSRRPSTARRRAFPSRSSATS